MSNVAQAVGLRWQSDVQNLEDFLGIGENSHNLKILDYDPIQFLWYTILMTVKLCWDGWHVLQEKVSLLVWLGIACGCRMHMCVE